LKDQAEPVNLFAAFGVDHFKALDGGFGQVIAPQEDRIRVRIVERGVLTSWAIASSNDNSSSALFAADPWSLVVCGC
jgi:hypothetical protein